jgi:hypothetical protein
MLSNSRMKYKLDVSWHSTLVMPASRNGFQSVADSHCSVVA